MSLLGCWDYIYPTFDVSLLQWYFRIANMYRTNLHQNITPNRFLNVQYILQVNIHKHFELMNALQSISMCWYDSYISVSLPILPAQWAKILCLFPTTLSISCHIIKICLFLNILTTFHISYLWRISATFLSINCLWGPSSGSF